jgi:hypothetical protein
VLTVSTGSPLPATGSVAALVWSAAFLVVGIIGSVRLGTMLAWGLARLWLRFTAAGATRAGARARDAHVVRDIATTVGAGLILGALVVVPLRDGPALLSLGFAAAALSGAAQAALSLARERREPWETPEAAARRTR